MRTDVKNVVEQTVVGLDLSVRRPAACAIPAGWDVGDWSAVTAEAWDFAEDGDIIDQHARCVRYVKIAGLVRDFVLSHGARPSKKGAQAPVFLEDYAFSMFGPASRKLSELGGVVKVELFAHGCTPTVVTASQCRKQLLGKDPAGKGKKAHVQGALWRAGAPIAEELVRKHVGAKDREALREVLKGQARWGEDECDALTVANAGRAILGMTALFLG